MPAYREKRALPAHEYVNRSSCGPRYLRAAVLLSMAVASRGATGALAQASRSQVRDTDSTTERQPGVIRTLQFGRTLVKPPDADDMIAIPFSTIPKRIQGAIAGDVERPMQRGASPFEHTPLRLKEHIDAAVRVYMAFNRAQDDLVEFQWTYRGNRMTVLVGRNGSRIQFRLNEIPACQLTRGAVCVDSAKNWVETVLRLKGVDRFDQEYRVEFAWPDQLVDGVSFSSAPDRDVMKVFRWHWRVDAEIEKGILTVLIYKRIAQLMSYQDGSKWFPEEFRTFLHQKAREQGKATKRNTQVIP